jgi:hypothetical protein
MLGYHGTKKKQTLGIHFHTIPRKRKKLEGPFLGTKIEANFQNFVPKHFEKKKHAFNSVY